MKFILLFVLIQISLSKDLIKFLNGESTFQRYEDGECYSTPEYDSKGKVTKEKSVYYSFDDDEIEIENYNSNDCSGDVVSTEKMKLNDYINKNSYNYTDCPEYVGFIIPDKTDNCDNEERGVRTYFKTGCHKQGSKSFQFAVHEEKLLMRSFSTKGCTGDSSNTFYGTCDSCTANKHYVQCGSISTMIILLLTFILFLF